MSDSSRWYPPPPARQPLTVVIPPRQAAVLTGLCHGLSNGQIARRLNISESAVKVYTRRLYLALGARDRCHAVAMCATGQVDVIIRDGRAGKQEDELAASMRRHPAGRRLPGGAA